MKRSPKKLSLNRETIGNLSNDRLAGAAGGGKPFSGYTYCNSVCVTYCNCPSQIETDCCQNTNLGCVQTYRC
jgi:hypothetical protein